MSATFLTTKNSLSKGTKRSGGFSLVETILYTTLLVLVIGVVVQMFISISGIYKNIKLARELESSGAIAMEQMLREIRNASKVEVSESLFGSSPGVLKISGIDEVGNSYNIKFNISSGIIQVSKNDDTPVAITSSSVNISYLLFSRVANANSEGIKIELEVSPNIFEGGVSKSERFYGFAVLRGSY